MHLSAKINNLLYHIHFYVISILFILSSCDKNPDISDGEDNHDSDDIIIEFSILTRNIGSDDASRTLVLPSGETEIGFAAENYLDLNNLTFLLFDGSKKMLRVFRPEVTPEDDLAAPYVKYKVRASLHDNYFLKATSEYITFTIVVLGNYADLSPQYFSFHIGQTLDEIFDPAKVGTFAMPRSNNDNDTWIPALSSIAGQDKGHIPMSGMQTFTVKMSKLRESSLNKPYQLSEGSESKYVNMLRALAKIEIIDLIGYTSQSEESYSIQKVELIGHATRGSILPTFQQWIPGIETQYVDAPSVPRNSQYIGALPFDGLEINASEKDALRNFFIDNQASALRGDGCRVFSCYLTEYDPAELGSTPPMWMRLTLLNEEKNITTRYRLEAYSYNDGSPNEPVPFLRNNIYRYVITGANDIRLEIQPFANLALSFGFGLLRDKDGDLMVLPDENGQYPDYFTGFLNNHGHPLEIDEEGNTTGNIINLTKGDYYAIVVGENQLMSDAKLRVKDSDSCYVLSNFGEISDDNNCSARLVEDTYGNNLTERFLKDKFGFRRIYHFNNHNSIVRDPVHENLLFCMIDNFQQEGETRKYFEVESWDDATKTGWIINKNSEGIETGFQEIKSDGTLGATIPLT